ncbi:uncharacterized protein LOC135084538 [Ostrinia nubilalis]|uniref:uncharacterized protein LOC135084538 n=1 Tax=Ostrinia nubilalis TaxID=29057 RepID=UPI0030822567
MKVLVAAVLALGSVSALGSGPYLPSGWRPDGPAFYLPSQPRQTVVALKDVALQGSEGSGSDFLREYGPPQVQSLPDVATEQSFVVLEAKFGEEEGVSVEAATEVSELRSSLVEESATTESIESVEEVTQAEVIEGRSLNLEVEAVAEKAEVTQEVATLATAVEQEVNAKSEASVEEVSAKIETDVAEEVKAVEEGVKNIAEAIVGLEKEVVAKQVQISQDLTAFKSVEQSSGAVVQVPEGFLEYGPPGFKEYGPPKQDALLRNVEATTSEEEKVENNETRRRRFSPKFRSTKKH